MDNRGAAAVEPGGMAGADLDLQDQLHAMGARASPKHEVVWIRGHPERRSKPRSQWDRHEQAIFDVDKKPLKHIKIQPTLAGCTGTTGGNSDLARDGKSGSRDEESRVRSLSRSRTDARACE